MSLYQRNGIYHAKIYIPGRKEPVRFSCGTRDYKKAKELHDKKAEELWRLVRLGDKPRRTWDEAAVRWLQEKRDKVSYAEDCRYIKWFTQFLRGRYLDEITRDMVDELLMTHKADVTPRTRDAHVALIRGVFRRAMREWEWINHVPAFRTYERGKQGRVRWLTREQVQKLLGELPRHTRMVMLFSLATGLRVGNVLGLRWSDVHGNVAYVERTKNGDPLTVPLSAMACGVLDSVRGEHATYVFSYKGQPLQRVNTRAWRKALNRAGIDNFRWHDLRHTWASWLRQNGVPTWALQGLAGWKSASMANRYAHISVDHLAQYAEIPGTIWAQSEIERMLGNDVSR